MSVFRLVVSLCLLSASLHAEDLTRNVPRVGGLCVLEASESVTWVVAYPEVDIYATNDGRACFVDTSDKRTRVILGIHGAPVGTAPVVDRWQVIIGGEPVPPGPGPDPEPEPEPTPPQPDTFTAWVTKTAAEQIPAAEQANIPKAVEVYRDQAQAAGTDLFTGPAIRLATNNALLMRIPSIQKWSTFLEALDAANGEWAREEYRDASSYRERWLAIADGLAAVAPRADVSSTRPRVVATIAGTHQIRNGQLLERVCINGRCVWANLGDIDKVQWIDGQQQVTLKD